MFVMFFVSGCVGPEVRESINALRRDHETYRRAVVANPAYSAEERATVDGLGGDIAKHLEKLQELVK